MSAAQVASSHCRTCHAPIWFGRTVKGRRMPIDPVPSEDGNVVVDTDMLSLDRLGDIADGCPVRVLRKGEVVDDATPRYLAHWASCTNPERHRREDRKRNGSRAKARAMGMEPA